MTALPTYGGGDLSMQIPIPCSSGVATFQLCDPGQVI